MTSSPARLFLVRHGQTAHNAERRMQGHADVPLDAIGHDQARRLASHLHATGVRAPRIHSSDLSRAAQTAAALHGTLGGTLQHSPRLREVSMGDWEGKLYADIRQSDPARFERFWSGDVHAAAPNGETPAQVADRVFEFLHHAGPGPGETVFFVSHGIAVASLIARLMALDYATEMASKRIQHVNTAYSVLTLEPGTWRVLDARLAIKDHLEAPSRGSEG